MPHPVLLPRNSDYASEYKFDVDIKTTHKDDGVLLSVRYSLTSGTLSDCIKRGDAKYFLVVKCNRTSKRDVHITDKSRFEWKLDQQNYEGKISLIPYIANTNNIKSFISPEHITDIREFSSAGFDLPPGSILAIADPYEITLSSDRSAESIISLVPDDTIERDRYAIDLNEQYVLIRLHGETLNKLNNMRGKPSEGALYPSLYLPALEYAMREYYGNVEDYKDAKWAESIRSILEEKNLTINEGEVGSSIHKIVQTLLENPLGALFRSPTEDDGDE